MIRHIVVFGPEHGEWLQDLSELAVLSYQELTQDINIQPLARIEL